MIDPFRRLLVGFVFRDGLLQFLGGFARGDASDAAGHKAVAFHDLGGMYRGDLRGGMIGLHQFQIGGVDEAHREVERLESAHQRQ